MMWDRQVGLIHAKRLLNEGFINGFDNIALRKIPCRSSPQPGDYVLLDDLPKELRNTHQMAILLDEYGGMAGLWSRAYDLLRTVGEIDDETDKAEIGS